MMEMMTKIDKDKKSKIEKAIKILKNGGVAVFPTDTVYGIGSLPEKKAVEKTALELLPVLDTIDEREISNKLYGIAESCGLESKALFVAIYKVLINKDQGPRLANFMKILGTERLQKLLKNF